MKAGGRKKAASGPVPDAKKRKVLRATPDIGPPGDQEPRATRGHCSNANRPEAAAQQAVFDPNAWAQTQIDSSLAAELKKLYAAAQQPSADGCWTFTGAPLAKDEVRVNYSRPLADTSKVKQRNGIFLDPTQISSKDELDRKKSESRPWALFHFQGLVMHDKDTDEQFEVKLGDCVILRSDKLTKRGSKTAEVQEELIGRVIEIMYTVQGERLVRVHWMYRIEDTALAAAPKGVSEKDKELWQGQLPVSSYVRHPRLLWVSATEADNERYNNMYSLETIDRPVRVIFIPPGFNHPDEVPQELCTWEDFDDATDYFYNGSTSTDHITFEDVFEDWRLFSPRYTELWQREGVEGIKRLWERCSSGSLSDLDRGFTKKKLERRNGKRVLNVMELFAGGGGFSHLAQQSTDCAIVSTHANDINESAAASYACNVKTAQVSACGLEEYTQLHIKWGAAVDQFLGEGWQPVVASLRSCTCQKRYSRQHMPQGVGCCGSIVGQQGTSGDGFEAAARRAEGRLKEWQKDKGAEDDSDAGDPEPDWDTIIDGLVEVEPDSDQADEEHLPDKPDNLATDKRLAVAYKDARAQQLQRIEECRTLLGERALGKVLEVRNVRIVDCAPRVTKGSSKKQLEEALEPWKCWLEFEALFARNGGSSSSSNSSSSTEWVWVPQALLWRSDAVLPMRHFMLRMIHDKTIPLPGDVHLLTGGPPCQNVSGLNRHAKQESVLEDAKNRLVVAYLRLVRYLKPNYFIMEQVKDIFTKEQGMYARYTLQTMIDLGYQVRAGICTAGNYGVAQGRLRALVLGARSGLEQLPPFPAATHHCKPFNISCPVRAQDCRVQQPTGVRPQDAKLLPMVLGGDILTDLPETDNFFEGDRQLYAKEPEYIPQAFLRRPPPAHERSLEERCIWADAAMQPWQQLQQLAPKILDEADESARSAKILAVGAQTLCKNKGEVTIDCVKAAAARNGTKGKAAAAAAASTEDDQEDEEDEGATAAAVAAAAADGDDEGDAKDAAELAAELKASKNFANETWKCHLAEYSKEETDWQILNMLRDAELHNVSYTFGVRRLHLLTDANKEASDAPLRDHRALLCNADDYLRMCAVPKEKGANFRDMPGVVTHADKKTCAGSWHAEQYLRRYKDAAKNKEQADRLKANLEQWHKLSEAEQAAEKDVAGRIFKGLDLVVPCPGGGCPPKPPQGFKRGVDGNDRSYRVDNYGSIANNSWRSIRLEKCCSAAYWGASGDLICPRWCVTYKKGESNGRHGCYGRFWHDDLQQTVVTRAEPHNLQLLHPDQDRVLSIRENARCQGFPDYHVFVGLAHAKGKTGSHGKGSATVDERYLQIGNAVAPPLAAALGRCLLLAATEDAPVGIPVVAVPDPEYEAVVEDCKQRGIGFWCQKPGNKVDLSKRNDYYWKRHNSAVKVDEEDAAEQSDAADEDDAPTAAAAAAAPSGRKQHKNKAAAEPSGATGNAAAAAGSSKAAVGSTKQQQQKRKANSSTEEPARKRSGSGAGSNKAAAASGGAAGATSAKQTPAAAADAAAGSSKAAGSGSSRPAAAAGTGFGNSGGATTAAAGSGKSRSAAAGSGGAAAAATPGSGRSKRAAAAAATAAIRKELGHERTPVKKLAAVAQGHKQQSAAAAVVPPASPAAAAAAAQLRQQQPAGLMPASPAAAGGAVAGTAAEQTDGSLRSSSDLLAADEPRAEAETAAAGQQKPLAEVAATTAQGTAEEGSEDEELISV